MDLSGLNLPKIRELFHDTNIMKAAQNQPAILPDGKTQAPGYSPTTIAQVRKRKYTDIQLEECIKLSRTVGTDLACKQLCVNPASLYGYAKRKILAVGKAAKKRNTKPVKYSPEQLTKVVKQAMEWHRNAPQASSLRKCCLRAGEQMRINGHTAYGWFNLHREEFRSGSR